MRTRIVILFILFLSLSTMFGQNNNYKYSRELNGISSTWHKVILPDDIFSKISRNLSDIRVIGITKNNDTIEAPYILQQTSDKFSKDEIQFKLINQSRNQNGYFYTFEISSIKEVNQLVLDFKQQNFDWKVKLEGSQDLNEWFTIVDDYRLLSIKNDLTYYKFSTISFPNSRYRFFRLMVQSNEKPDLLTAKVFDQNLIEGSYKKYSPKEIKVLQDKNLRQTNIEMTLPMSVPAAYIKLFVENQYDYYRPVEIMYLTDSINTQKGWKYNYELATTGTLSSLEDNEFKFTNTVSNKFKITISNFDNQPLKIDSINIKGNIYQLLVRFTEDAKYYLIYGNPDSYMPDYDINKFIDKIPGPITGVSLGNEQRIGKKDTSEITPLFQNKAWLWLIMIIIISLLGWFTFSMMKKK